jgi:hypothetical protein
VVDLVAAQLKLGEINWDAGDDQKALAALSSARDVFDQAKTAAHDQFDFETPVLRVETN